MRVIVLNKGYYGGRIRDPGETFEFPDREWADEDKRPSWVEPADGSGHADADDPDDGDDGESKPKKRGRKPKQADKEPAGNGVTEALGSPPDWLPPGGADALKDGE